MRKLRLTLLLGFLVMAAIFTVNSQEEEPPTETAIAPVESVEFGVALTNGIEIEVSGNLPDGCTAIAGYEQSVNGGQIFVTLYIERDPELMCTMALVPYQETVQVDTALLPDGTYRVVVNGQQTAIMVTVRDNSEEGFAMVAAVVVYWLLEILSP